MALSSSLFTGTSGLKNMGNAMQVVGNNISNVNTVGFKRGRSTFADTLYESVATRAGTDQMGRGMAIGEVGQNFDQGSFESTGNTTDLSIGGDGFFIVRQQQTERNFYTRAGNFFFDKDGRFVNPEGYIVQGWDLDEETGEDVGAINDLVLNAFTSAPEKSSKLTTITNLDADATSKSVVLSNNWDSGKETYMEGTNYEYQTVIKAYDSLGSTHDITVHYDKKSGTEWEYTVTSNPEEDKRNLVQETDSKGLLARGTIQFSQSSGDILDMTMSKFTGRLGNFTATGVNTVDDINYKILNYQKAALDGYGFKFEFDGATWDFSDLDGDGNIDADDKPENYAKAKIVYSDNQEIHLALAPENATDNEIDLKIQLDQPAVATDSLGFDINNKNDLHVQGIEGTQYFGDTANDNTTLEINDPNVMTHDSKGLGIVWNPESEKWYWSNPADANTAGTLISDLSLTSNTGGTLATTAATTVVDNAIDISMYAEDIKLRYDTAAAGTTNGWDWNQALKEEDFDSTFDFQPKNDPVLTIPTVGSEGVRAISSAGVSPTLWWLGDQWSLSSSGPATTTATFGTTNIELNDTASNDTTALFDLWYDDPAGASTIQYTFGSALSTAGGQSISFFTDPTPPKEYADAVLTSSGVTGTGVAIDLEDNNTKDLTINPTAGGDTVDSGSNFVFTTDPNVPPAEYANATLRGDETQAIIDLDGSGNESDNEDIKFTFADSLKFGGSTHPYNDRSEIDFDIVGSTAWTPIDKNEIAQTGYFSFTADFLGGDFGSTENDIQFDVGTVYDGTNFVNDSMSTTQFAKASSTIFQDADGYSAGDLQSVDVGSDGIITGVYSNGELIPLFRVGLAKFLNNYGLSNEGGNLFRETRDSGAAITNKPGENGLGTISPNSLEMSNVDISEEFVNMITTQRGFQANSKTVTTTDEMMQTVINMKR
mgnify:CR=1 FL=1